MVEEKERFVIKKIRQRLPVFLLIILAILIFDGAVLAFEIITPGSFWLTAENQGKHNRIDIEWENLGDDTYYVVEQYDSEMGDWQTGSTSYGQEIDVLNVYPNIPESAGLADWMDAEGKELINVTPISMDEFNSDPDFYLKPNGEYRYDVVAFGFWDSNYNVDLTTGSLAAVRAFYESGRGVLFGHDTIHRTNFKPFILEAVNIDNSTAAEVGYTGTDVGSSVIKSINNGFLLNYPWEIPYDEELTVPFSHMGHTFYPKGIVWMEYVPPFGNENGGFNGPGFTRPDGTSNNSYLTTWNNAAYINTGHTRGESDQQEQRVLANLLIYLAQHTEDTKAEMNSAMDTAAPEPASAFGYDRMSLELTSVDNGTPHLFRVQATDKHTNTTITSNEVREYCTTGVKGFYIIGDNISNTVPNTEDSSQFYEAEENGTYSFDLSGTETWVHVITVDHAGNKSEVAHIELESLVVFLRIAKETDTPVKEEVSFVFRIDYRQEEDGEIVRSFYSRVTVAAGFDAGFTDVHYISQGFYTVTEIESNWRYELDGASDRIQQTELSWANKSDTILYQNNLTANGWVGGSSDVINKLETP